MLQAYCLLILSLPRLIGRLHLFIQPASLIWLLIFLSRLQNARLITMCVCVCVHYSKIYFNVFYLPLVLFFLALFLDIRVGIKQFFSLFLSLRSFHHIHSILRSIHKRVQFIASFGIYRYATSSLSFPHCLISILT
jgi:hypothetical protein